MADETDSTQSEKRGSRKRFIVACALMAALALMLYPPVRVVYNATGRSYSEHRFLWNGRGSLDWSRLILELCLVAVIGALTAVVAPMVRRRSGRAPKVWVRRAGLTLGVSAVLILAATAAYDAVARFALLRDYNRKVQEFEAKRALLQEAFPLDPSSTGGSVPEYHRISNFHELEFILRRRGCNSVGIQRAIALFLSASERYRTAILDFGVRVDGSLDDSDIFTASGRPNVIEFYLGDYYADYHKKRFFEPLPSWYTEALEHNIDVSLVPYDMKPGEPLASWSFTDWLGTRSPWLILAAGMLAVNALCFVVGSRIDRTAAGTNSSVGGVRSD